MKNFASPHVHVQSLDSASTPEAFAIREAELGTGVLTVTDHGSLGACQKVYELAKNGVKIPGSKDKIKLQPILGLEGYFRDDNCPIFEAAGIPKRYPKDKEGKEDRSRPGSFVEYLKYAHFTTHFIDQDAYRTGVRILSQAPVEQHGSETKPLFNWNDMEELGGANTIVTTGCLIGMVQRHLLDHQDPEMARKYFDRLRAIVRPGNLYVEVFPHVCSSNWVTGVFVTLEDPQNPETPQKLKWYAGKTLKTNVGEIKAKNLAKAFNQVGNKHTHLEAVKDNRTWVPREPARILEVKHIEEFLPNECGPYAPGGDVQLGANRWMLDLAKSENVPVLVSDDSHYAHPEEHVVQDMRLAQSGNWRFFGSYHRQDSQEAFRYFNERLGINESTFEGWVENSHEWASRFRDFKLENKPSLPVKFYEPLYETAGVKTSLKYTMHLVKQHGRMDWKDPVRVQRLRQEINLLYHNETIDLLPYFMLDEEVCRLYRDAGLLTGPGRGSAAGLLLAYLLGITHVDPLRYGLSVDRFLTATRVASGKMPDIDQDLSSRELLVGEDGNSGWLKARFGDHYAPISADTTLKLKSAVLDCARLVLGHVPPDIQALTKDFLMPPPGLEDIKFVLGYTADGAWVEGSLSYDPALKQYAAQYPEQFKIVKKALGLARQKTRHACAVVVGNVPITEMGIPLTTVGGVRVTAFTAPSVEAVGGLKMDFLVVNSLNDIQDAIRLIQARSGLQFPASGVMLNGRWVPTIRLVPLPGVSTNDSSAPPEKLWCDIWDLPEDQEVFAEIAQGKTETVFQLSTPGAQQLLRHFASKKPNGNFAIDSIEALSAFTALDRPGPLDAYVKTPGLPDCQSCGGKPCTHGKHNMLVEFARRSRGAEPSPDVFPIFDQLFPETHGVMVYQEQLQRLYQEVTGCTGAEAEEFRGNVAKKKTEKIMAAYPGFIAGATQKLGSEETAKAVWQFINTWASYGFNKSHAVCYMITAYATAWLKYHYKLEWWCSVLRHAKKDEVSDKFWKFIKNCILLPDLTEAHENFEIVGDKIQAPLSLLHGVGEKAHQELVAGAPYASIRDLLVKIEAKKVAGTGPVTNKEGVTTIRRGRSALSHAIVCRLIIAGAMDRLFPQDWTTLQMLEHHEHTLWELENEARLAMTPPKKTKKTAKPVAAKYRRLNQYTRLQFRKEILPAYSEPVLPLLVERCHPTVSHNGQRYVYHWANSDRPLPLASPAGLERINEAASLPSEGYKCAAAVYIESVRMFNYGEDKEKKAAEVVVDLDGEKYKFVRWPNRDTGELDERFTISLKDCLAILVLGKFKPKKPFSIDDIEVVQAAPGTEPEPETDEEQS